MVPTITFTSPAAGVEVSVREHASRNLRTIYRLSADWLPESAGRSDRYWEAHRQLFQSGELDHAPEDCPDRTDGVVVRVWDTESGWKEMRLPTTFAGGDPPRPAGLNDQP